MTERFTRTGPLDGVQAREWLQFVGPTVDGEVLLGVRARPWGGIVHLRSSHQLQTVVHVDPKLRVTNQ